MVENIDGEMLKKMLSNAARLLEINKEEVNSLNVFPVPDGDTGTNMYLTIKSAVKQGLVVEDNHVWKISQAVSQGSLMGARGNSGVILSQLFRGFANGLKGVEVIDVKSFASAFKQSADTAYKAVMKPTEGTILTVARECGEYALKICNEEKDIERFLKRVIDKGNETLSRTPDMLPVLKQAGVVDAGGKGLIYILTGAYNALIGLESEVVEVEETPVRTTIKRAHIDTDDIKFSYCTEFMINTNPDNIESLRDLLSEKGDSLLVVGGGDIIKVHIHTNNPGYVLEEALKLGELTDIKIDNMKYQHEEILLKQELQEIEKKDKPLVIDKKYSIIAVSIGEGIDALFKELNVDILVQGGQTMNPSTEDFLTAINNSKGENIIILPNNSNIILAAQQTKELSSRNISIIPTKSIPQGISAILALDEDDSIENNIKAMTEAYKEVITGQVTYAVRDTELNDKKIFKDDIIGLSDKDILAAGKDINMVSTELIEKLVNENTNIISIFHGMDIDEKLAQDLYNNISKKYKNIDVEVIYGGQPLYYYIFSIE